MSAPVISPFRAVGASENRLCRNDVALCQGVPIFPFIFPFSTALARARFALNSTPWLPIGPVDRTRPSHPDRANTARRRAHLYRSESCETPRFAADPAPDTANLRGSTESDSPSLANSTRASQLAAHPRASR